MKIFYMPAAFVERILARPATRSAMAAEGLA